MKKLILAIGLLFLVSSCGSSWSCKKRYCKTDAKAKTETNIQINKHA